MTDLRMRLRAALDDDEDAMPLDDAAAIRSVVVAAARGRERRPQRMWIQPLAVAATLVVMVAVGIAIGERFDARPVRGGADRNLPARSSPDRARQLHFSTPGGTRIIWIFNSDLDLKTTP